MFLKLIMISSILILISLIGLGIRTLLKKQGKFPETHVGHNAEMQKRGITCAKQTDTGCNPTGGNIDCHVCNPGETV